MSDKTPSTASDTDLRPVNISTGVSRYAEGSARVEFGNTSVLCTASLEMSVPRFLRGTDSGWVTAEYSMLPRATHSRTRRETNGQRGRTQEIQRLIGRALRQCVDLKALGERQYTVDCDVLQADGGTRVASVTGGAVALYLALHKTIPNARNVWRGWVAAVSVALAGDRIVVDPDYHIDSNADADMNLIANQDGGLIEVQVTAERAALPRERYDAMIDAGLVVIEQLIEQQKAAVRN